MQDILMGHNTLTPAQIHNIGSQTCLLALAPSENVCTPLYNARYLERFVELFSRDTTVVGAMEVEQIISEPALRDIAVAETVSYITNIADMSAVDMRARPCLYRTNLHHAYTCEEAIDETDLNRHGGYYPLISYDKKGQINQGVMTQQLLTIPGGPKTAAAIEYELDNLGRQLFNATKKRFPHNSKQLLNFDYLLTDEPLNFVHLYHPTMRDLRQRYNIDIKRQTRLGEAACFLGLNVATNGSTRFNLRYMSQALKATCQRGVRSIADMHELAGQPAMQELIASEVDRYIEAVAKQAVINPEGQLDIYYKNLAVVGRTVHNTYNMGARDGYRPLLRDYSSGSSGIMSEQFLTVPGSGHVIEVLRRSYTGVKASLLSAIDIHVA